MSDQAKFTKVYVDLPNHWTAGREFMWARPLGGDRYELRNLPFHAYDLNWGDIVQAVPNAPDEEPRVRRVIIRSGHQTLRVFFNETVPEERRLELVRSLKPLHVSFERATRSVFALDLEPRADMARVRVELDWWAESGWAEYETCEARIANSFDDAPEGQDE